MPSFSSDDRLGSGLNLKNLDTDVFQSNPKSVLPHMERSPPRVQIIRDSPIDPTPLIMTFGEMKIPKRDKEKIRFKLLTFLIPAVYESQYANIYKSKSMT